MQGNTHRTWQEGSLFTGDGKVSEGVDDGSSGSGGTGGGFAEFFVETDDNGTVKELYVGGSSSSNERNPKQAMSKATPGNCKASNPQLQECNKAMQESNSNAQQSSAKGTSVLDMEELHFDPPSDLEEEEQQEFPEEWFYGGFTEEDIVAGQGGNASAQNSSRVRKRLRKKTRPNLTPYADIIPLASKCKAQARKRKIQEIIKQNKAIIISENSEALRQTQQYAGSLSELAEARGDSSTQEVDWTFASRIHDSHNIKVVGGNQEAFYCHHCSCWNAGGPLRKLKEPCQGFVSKTSQAQHKMLQSGIIPWRGARIPYHRKW